MTNNAGSPGAGATASPTTFYFQTEFAMPFILATSTFGIFWGILNILLVSHSDDLNGHFSDLNFRILWHTLLTSLFLNHIDQERQDEGHHLDREGHESIRFRGRR